MRFNLPARPAIILRSVFIVLFVGLVIYSVFFTDLRPDSIADVKQELAGFGVWAPLVMIILHTISVVMLIPGFLMVLATAIIFGLDSIWISMVGQLFGSLAAYFLARWVGRDVLHAVLGQRVVAMERILEEHGFYYLLYLRLMGFLPLPLLAYGPGLVRVPFWHVFFATLLGQAPFIVVVGIFGESLTRIREPLDLLTPVFLIPLLFLLALLVFPIAISLLVRRIRRRHLVTEPEPPEREVNAPETGEPDGDAESPEP